MLAAARQATESNGCTEVAWQRSYFFNPLEIGFFPSLHVPGRLAG